MWCIIFSEPKKCFKSLAIFFILSAGIKRFVFIHVCIINLTSVFTDILKYLLFLLIFCVNVWLHRLVVDVLCYYALHCFANVRMTRSELLEEIIWQWNCKFVTDFAYIVLQTFLYREHTCTKKVLKLWWCVAYCWLHFNMQRMSWAI